MASTLSSTFELLNKIKDEKLVISAGNFTIYDADMVPTLWWILLVIGSFINLVILLNRLAHMGKCAYSRKMTYCSAVFIVACAVRSIWPRVDVERICFWDSSLSVTFVGRCLATAAEICFAAQFSMTVGILAKELKHPRAQKFADVCFWAICIAQCCCWLGVTTQRQIWHGLEESIWALTFTGIGVCFASIYWSLRHKSRKARCCYIGMLETGEIGYAKRVLIFGFPGCVAYVIFMVLVDIPMYLERYHADQARGASYLWVSEGVLNSMSCNTVSKSMADWAPEMPWMTGYFLGATAMSLWLSWGPQCSNGSNDDRGKGLVKKES